MGLVKKASELLQGVRRRRNDSTSPRQYNEEKVNVRSTGRIGRFIVRHKLGQHRLKPEAQTHGRPENTTEAAMEYETEYMHEHDIHRMERPRVLMNMAEPQCVQITEVVKEEDIDDEEEDDEGEDEGDGAEDISRAENDDDESEDEVEESVIEDMRKLEESFRGISRKYRLINRIGEGDINTYTHRGPRRQSNKHLRHILHSLQS
jgi:hypothetical protein